MPTYTVRKSRLKYKHTVHINNQEVHVHIPEFLHGDRSGDGGDRGVKGDNGDATTMFLSS